MPKGKAAARVCPVCELCALQRGTKFPMVYLAVSPPSPCYTPALSLPQRSVPSSLLPARGTAAAQEMQPPKGMVWRGCARGGFRGGGGNAKRLSLNYSGGAHRCASTGTGTAQTKGRQPAVQRKQLKIGRR